MKFPLLNNPAVTSAEREFVEQQLDGSNPAHQQKVAAEIYSAAVNRQSSNNIIASVETMSDENAKYSRAMKWMTAALVFAAIVQAYAAWQSVGNEDFANKLNTILTENSNKDLEVSRKKLSFDIINTLYRDFYQFGQHNSLIIRKLKGKQVIEDEFNLGLYLNSFEDLYEQCKRGLISREDVRVHFEHLIGPTCNNQQVESVVGKSGNGLKLLCRNFFPSSRLSKLAKSENDSCH